MLLVLHVLVQLWHSVDLVAIDNDVQGKLQPFLVSGPDSLSAVTLWRRLRYSPRPVSGDPTVECGDSSLTFSVKTKKLFAGRIFVKGKTAEPPCIRSDFAKQTTSTPVFELNFGSCGMRGQRAVSVRLSVGVCSAFVALTCRMNQEGCSIR